jgi:LuxR family maltose regulon positive regulatory protein
VPVLTTKLYIPPPRPGLVSRPHLVERLDQGWQTGRKLSLISAAAGFGKTTLLSEWIHQNVEAGMQNDESRKTIHPSKFAWLSLDEGDKEPSRFLTYLIAALQTISPDIGAGLISALQSPQPPSSELILTGLLNEIAAIPDKFVLILDDYHVVDARPVDQALSFLLEHLPPQMHLVIATRDDPFLPLARMRARGQLTELRAADLRFTPAEAAEFLNQVMGLNLSADEIDALETRTEGWIAGLHMAALSMQGQQDIAGFIKSFTGSHHFVLDYLLEEVLQQQPERVKTFLLRTSNLSRMCGPLCDTLLQNPASPGQETLETIERSNLFIVPLDNERHWYRYHHLFGELLRQRLGQHLSLEEIAADHIRASQWYEDNGLAFEAFHHAIAANDIERAERLIESKHMPLHFHSVAMTIVDWLVSLPKTILDARPWLWVKSCTLALMAGQTSGVEERIQAAEKALENMDPALGSVEGIEEKIRDQIGQIACARATLALTRYQPEEMIIQARRALEYLSPNNLVFCFTANWALASAYFLQGERAAAARACEESLSISQKSGDIFSTVLATANLGQAQELENQLHQAATTYQSLLPLFSEHPQPNAAEVYLGLARIYYEWNDLETAEQHGQQSLKLARLYDRVIDRFIISEVFLARLKKARGDVEGAAALLAQAEQSARQKNFLLRMPEIAAEQVLVLLKQGNLTTAAALAEKYDLSLSRARILLAQGDPTAALEIIEPFCQQMESQNWRDERLKAMVLQIVAYQAIGETDLALQVLGDTLALAETGGFVRIFLDEGPSMREVLKLAEDKDGIPKAYICMLLVAFETETKDEKTVTGSASLVEPLSQRELEILRLIAQGLSNRQICERLFLALDTVKGHNRRIYDKLQVKRRTEAVARARELGLL